MPNIVRSNGGVNPPPRRLNGHNPPRDLHDLADEPYWVAWREEQRNGKTSKVPIDPRTGRRAQVPTNPETWGTRAQAERRWHDLKRDLDDDLRGGIGIVLDELVGEGCHLLGIDLDGCMDKHGRIDDFSCDIIEQLSTYAEMSPSKRGVKMFFLVTAGDMNEVAG
jgi:putative DNA primase/helicase